MEELNNILIQYNEEENYFIIAINGIEFIFYPNEFVEFVNRSIEIINEVILLHFDKSMIKFLRGDRDSSKIFPKGEEKKIADEVDRWLKSRYIQPN